MSTPLSPRDNVRPDLSTRWVRASRRRVGANVSVRLYEDQWQVLHEMGCSPTEFIRQCIDETLCKRMGTDK